MNYVIIISKSAIFMWDKLRVFVLYSGTYWKSYF